MIEEVSINENDNPALKKPEQPISKEEQKEKVIGYVTLPKFDENSFKIFKEVRVDNIYNDETDFVIEAESGNQNYSIRVSRDLAKQLIYDLYLK